jgi:hypothetical protein
MHRAARTSALISDNFSTDSAIRRERLGHFFYSIGNELIKIQGNRRKLIAQIFADWDDAD